MSSESVVRRFLEEMWAKGNTDLIDVVVHEDYAADGRLVGREFVRRNMRRFRRGFPDHSVRILTLVASGDEGVLRRYGAPEPGEVPSGQIHTIVADLHPDTRGPQLASADLQDEDIRE